MFRNQFILLIVICLLFSACQNKPNNKTYENEPEWVRQAFNTANQHARNMLIDVLDKKETPRSLERGLKPSRDWTSGFYPGILWYLYDYNKDDFWKVQAETVTSFLEKEQYNTEDHDVGFRVYCSYGNGFLLAPNEVYKKVIVQAANSLASRYNSKTETIMSWNANKKRDWKYPDIIDNMMNLELIFEAAKLSADDKLTEIAIKHADRTMQYQYRDDYSCSHVVDYDPETGEFRKMDWNNGFCDPKIAAWSRGQGWSVYGFTLMYRATHNKKYLDFAEHIANYIINHPNMPEDMVPYWDYNSPKIPSMRDASAAAITASALLELSTYADEGNKYFIAAEKILKNLSSEEYLAPAGTNGNYLIKHATGNYLAASEINGTLIYADYYYVEALSRYLKLLNKKSIFLSQI